MAENEMNQGVMENETSRNLPSRTSVLVFGIISAGFLCSFWFSFVGIIFGFIARAKANAFARAGVPITGKVKVGRILGTIGAFAGIAMTVLSLIFFVCLIAGIVIGLSSPDASNSIAEFFKDVFNIELKIS